jgi:hypothetical protein
MQMREQMNKSTEALGLILGIASMCTFWLPPFGLFLGIAGLTISLVRKQQQRRFAVLAIVFSTLGILSFVSFWASVWVLSQ